MTDHDKAREEFVGALDHSLTTRALFSDVAVPYEHKPTDEEEREARNKVLALYDRERKWSYECEELLLGVEPLFKEVPPYLKNMCERIRERRRHEQQG